MWPALLLVGGSPGLASLTRAALAQTGPQSLLLECVTTLAAALARVQAGSVELLLVELDVPGAPAMAELADVLRCLPYLPVLAVGADPAGAVAREALALGAQDFLCRSLLDGHTLARAVQGALARKAAADALFEERERAQITLDCIADAVLSTDLQGRVKYLNRAAEMLTGWTSGEAAGRPAAEVFRVVDAQTRATGFDPVAAALRNNRNEALPANSILLRRDGSDVPIEDSTAPIRDRVGRVRGAVVVFRDVAKMRALALKMTHFAEHDFLTDLPNRLLLNDRLGHAIALARRHGGMLAILFLDVDHFKHINDSLGHHVGDELLKAVARRLQPCVRESDTVSRQGGDEFVVLLSEIERPEDAALMATKVRTAMMAPFPIGEQVFDLSVSIGISIYPADGEDGETLLKNADNAMYQAKDSGRDNYQYFRKHMSVRAVERQFIEAGLRRALDRGEFTLVYQPQRNLASGAVSGAEALIRWQHPERGLILPLQFIAIAESCGLIEPIGRWVLREACAQAGRWLAAGLPLDRMAVNISAFEFRSRGFVALVTAVLAQTGLEPCRLELEVTETNLMLNVDATNSLLLSLNAMGVRLAVDDFGTGYSSLSYLRRFPFDTLKIDKSFIFELTHDENDAIIVAAIITMANRLGLRVVAEGVETGEQLAFLRAKDCSDAQGYFFSDPLSADAFTRLLQSEQSDATRAPALAGATSRAAAPVPHSTLN